MKTCPCCKQFIPQPEPKSVTLTDEMLLTYERAKRIKSVSYRWELLWKNDFDWFLVSINSFGTSSGRKKSISKFFKLAYTKDSSQPFMITDKEMKGYIAFEIISKKRAMEKIDV